MGSGISLNNKQAVEVLKNEIKIVLSRKKSFTEKELDIYNNLIEFFRNHDKQKDCNNPQLVDYRNWLYDCEYDRLSKQLSLKSI